MPRSVPLDHVWPSADLANPMSDAPPLKKRPLCVTAMSVLPAANVSGSTVVACWLVEFVNGSVKILVSPAGSAWAVSGTKSNVASDAIAQARRRVTGRRTPPFR
jgi:hypothetical protein